MKTLILKILVRPSRMAVKPLRLLNQQILVLMKANLLPSLDHRALEINILTLAGGLQTPTTGRVLINQSDYSDLAEKNVPNCAIRTLVLSCRLPI